MGLSFAVPINLAMHVAAQLRATSRIRRARRAHPGTRSPSPFELARFSSWGLPITIAVHRF